MRWSKRHKGHLIEWGPGLRASYLEVSITAPDGFVIYSEDIFIGSPSSVDIETVRQILPSMYSRIERYVLADNARGVMKWSR